MTRDRRRPTNLTLSSATVAALRATGNASRYVDAVVAARDRRWRRALRFLLDECQWTAAAVIRGLKQGPGSVLPLPPTQRPALAALRVLVRERALGNGAVDATLEALPAPRPARRQRRRVA